MEIYYWRKTHDWSKWLIAIYLNCLWIWLISKLIIHVRTTDEMNQTNRKQSGALLVATKWSIHLKPESSYFVFQASDVFSNNASLPSEKPFQRQRRPAPKNKTKNLRNNYHSMCGKEYTADSNTFKILNLCLTICCHKLVLVLYYSFTIFSFSLISYICISSDYCSKICDIHNP